MNQLARLNQRPRTKILKNNSGLEPLGRAVLVKPYEPELKDSMIVLPPEVKARNTTIESRAIVIEIGPMCWDDEKNDLGQRVPRCAVGDLVMIGKYSGAVVIGTLDGHQYRMVNDRDIYCKIKGEIK